MPDSAIKNRGKHLSTDTLTIKTHSMNALDVMDMFRCYGNIINLNEYKNRFFIQFENPGEAKTAFKVLSRNLRVEFAHENTNPRPRRNYREPGELIRIAKDLPRGGYKVRDSSKSSSKSWIMGGETNMSVTKKSSGGSKKAQKAAKDSPKEDQSTVEQDQRERSDSPKPDSSTTEDPKNEPTSSQSSSDEKIEETEAEAAETEEAEAEEAESDDTEPEVEPLEGAIANVEDLDISHSVIMANIPERYTLDEVYDLVEEVKPVAFSEMDYSFQLKVKFCEIFVSDAADVDYLKQKLNDFVICGKQLAVLEPAELADESRWNA